MNTLKHNIAFIILNYFRSDLCKTCIESVFNELDAVIFLVDNSADTSEQQKIKKLFSEKNNIHLIFPKENLGFAGGVNIGLKQAIRKGYTSFFLLNNDALLKKGSGPFITKAINENPSALLSPEIEWNNRNCGYSYYHRFFGIITTNKPSLNRFGWLPYLTGCALILNAEILKKNGYLNKSFFMYGEDVEFCYRAIKNKIKVAIINKNLIIHQSGSSSMKTSFFYEYHINRAHFLLSIQTNQTNFSIISALILKTVFLSLRSVFRCIKFKKFTPATGFLLAPFNLNVRPNPVETITPT